MALAQVNFTRRRIINSALLLLACTVAWGVYQVSNITLANSSKWSGWTLFASSAVLLSYAIRKRLSTLPLGRVSSWLQLHIYLGLFGLYVFGLHLDWRLPNGWFEIALACAFFGTLVSGALGLFWSRSIPGALARLGDDVLYERIPEFATRLQRDAEQLVLDSVQQHSSHVLADFYQQVGHQFFARPRFQWARLYRSYQPHIRVLRELSSLRRYMAEPELVSAEEMRLLVTQKAILDTHFTLQGALKYWLFAHLAFALAVVPLLLLHIVLVYSFALL